MKISVVVPTYNSSKVIGATIESILRQTIKPDEILVLDDGSSDDTVPILNSYRPKVSVFQQTNCGVATARNELCHKASGELIAFLDHDDIWHARYLEAQSGLFSANPDAAAYFTGHFNFKGYGTYQWSEDPLLHKSAAELIDAFSFLKRYNHCPGPFASMSFCCLSHRIIRKMGDTPFCAEVTGADDFCLCNKIPLFGAVVYNPAPLVAYRFTNEAQSSNRLKGVQKAIQSFALLKRQYENVGNRQLACAFFAAFASKKRVYARMLMGAGKYFEAKQQLTESLRLNAGLGSFMKSAVLLCLVRLPRRLQPAWPGAYREI